MDGLSGKLGAPQGVETETTVWAYVCLEPDEAHDLADVSFASLTELRKFVHEKLTGRQLVFALADDLLISSWAVSCEWCLDALMEALLDLETADGAITDPDLAADLRTNCVDIQVIVDADDPAAAMVTALAALRVAIHAIGDATPGWETTTAAMHVAPAHAADRLLATT